MYRELKETDNWLVIGPGRTGSLVIVNIIRNAYLNAGIQAYERPHTDNATPILEKQILHSHEINVLKLTNKNTTVVLNTRNPIEIVLSASISEQNGVWHLWPKFWLDSKAWPAEQANKIQYNLSERESIDSAVEFSIKENYKAADVPIKPFYLDPEKFLSRYNSIVQFYRNIKHALPPNTITIDYKEFKDDNSIIFNKLNLKPVETLVKPLPIKNAGNHQQWISNWNEISNICRRLSTATI